MTKTWTFTVEGKGFFPHDMLRYDSAVPRDGAAVSVIARSPDRVGPRTTDTVRLRSYNPAGPTIGRWNSFGWLVLDIEKER